MTATKTKVRVRPRSPAEQKPAHSKKPSKKKVLQPAGKPKPMVLQDRDAQFLLALHENRFLSTDQARRHIFYDCSPANVRRRLRLHYDHRLVDRMALLAQPTRGIPPFVYVLADNGAAVLNDLGHDVTPSRFNPRRLQKFRHQFLVNDIRIRFEETCRTSPYSLVDWRHENRLLVSAGGGNLRPQLIEHAYLDKPRPFLPDGYFNLALPVEQGTLSFFVELDLATHRLKVWKQRARLFAAYATGFFRKRFGRSNFRLLIITTPDYRGRSRLRNILTTIHNELREIQVPAESRLFLGTTLTDLGIGPAAVKTRGGLLQRIWRQPDHPDQLVSLLPHGGAQVHSTAAGDRATVNRASFPNQPQGAR